jgi:hypothetical protein
MGYQLDSDVVYAYFGYSENLVHTIEHKEGLFKPPLPFEERHGTIHAAWVAKNCKSSSNREHVVQSIINAGVKVDSFGGCMHNKDFPSGEGVTAESLMKLLSRYKFYLSFENSICRHYYTEKLFRCFEAGVVPILLGHPADIEYFLPHKVRNMRIELSTCKIPTLKCRLFRAVDRLYYFSSHSSWAGCGDKGVGFSQHACSRQLHSQGRLGSRSVLQAHCLEEYEYSTVVA